MRATAWAVVASGGRLTRAESAPPLTLRKVFSESRDRCALCLVGSAAGPLPGDDLLLSLEILDGAQASLTASGAMIAQGRTGVPAAVRTSVLVGAEASLEADPGALIVCHGARVDVALDIAVTASSTLIWRELLVLGRSYEPPGAATLRWNVTRAGAPLLRQTLDLTDPALFAWPGMLAGARSVRTELRVGPDVDARTVVHSPTDVTQRIAENATLRTTLG